MNHILNHKYDNKPDNKIQEIYFKLEQLRKNKCLVTTPEELEALEREIRVLTDQLASLILGQKLQESLDSEESCEAEKVLVKNWPARLKNEGKIKVNVCTSTGTKVEISTHYYRRSCDKRKGKRSKGVYAGLVLLGIHERCTPSLASQIGIMAATLSSFAEAQQVLSELGVKLGVKVIRKIAYRCAERARVVQQMEAYSFDEDVVGRRVVVSTDGGRIRIRENKRGPKTNKGRTRYKGAWREPKLLLIYVVNEEGKMEKSFAPIIDGMIKGPDVLFELLRSYLHKLNIKQADQVLFVSDGAKWIWNRVSTLAKSLGLISEQIHELVDFYHAVEHLGSIARLRKSWNASTRKKWVKKQRGLLLKGEVEKVIEAVRQICRGRKGKEISTERDYFINNQNRMAYKKIKDMKLPIGSGGVESTIRRVVNLRLKGPCIFWLQENADAMLMLRSFFKAGRWNVLKSMANSPLSLMEK